jgi:hypothetical protein
MTGHVDKGQDSSGRERVVDEAKRNGDAAAALFGESVQIGACQRANQARFTVIDMTRGADDTVV